MPASTRSPSPHKPGCALNEVLITHLLDRRESRPPRHAEENAALVALAADLVNSPDAVLQSVADLVCRLCGAGSAGISLQEIEEGRELFRWRATSGQMAPYLNGVMPRDFSPCGLVLDRRSTLLMRDPARYYPYVSQLGVPIREALLTPFYKRGEPIGTVWILHHEPGRGFDAEDRRIVEHLARFASVASELWTSSRRVEGLGRQLAVVGSQMEHALEAANIGTWNWDPVGDRMFVDAKSARLFEVDEVQANGGPVDCYLRKLHPEDRERVGAALEEALAKGTPYQVEFRVPQADGSCRWLRSHGRVHDSGTPQARRMPGVLVDITEQRLTEASLRRSEAMLAEQNRRLEENVAARTAELDDKLRDLEAFSYTISHDLRAPLRAMGSYAELLEAELGEGAAPELREYARRIVRGAERMDRLTRDVLLISRLSGPLLPLEAVELGEFLRQMVESYPDLSSRHADIVVHGPLHPVLAHPAALTQCVSNLLSNAVKFVVPGQRPRVEIRTERVGGRVRLLVRDNGIGIAPRDQDRVFDIFYQVTPNARSSGIGLAIVRRAMERMGGMVEVDSRPGEGSTFCLDLAHPAGA